jgi:hypothetical protein
LAWSCAIKSAIPGDLARSRLDSDFKMAASHEIQYQSPDGPPPTVLNNEPENPFSDDNTLVELGAANDLTQITAPDLPTLPIAG